jgi:hypothetical protein
VRLPRYCIIFDRAVKAVHTPEGGAAILVYSPQKDEFEPATGLVHQFFCGEETDFVSEEEFNAFIAKQRADAKAKQPR